MLTAQNIASGMGPADARTSALHTFGGVEQTKEHCRDSLDPDQPVTTVQTLEEFRTEALASPRLTTILLGVFAALALIITATGLVGILAFSVSQRTHEIGIRMALGAQHRAVIGIVLGEGMALVTLGLAIGLVGAIALTRLMAGLLFSTPPTDVITFVAVSAVLLLAAGVSCLLPAQRAVAISPIIALRST